MDFNFTEVQAQLAQAIKRWVEKSYTFSHRANVISSEQGSSEQDWATLVELGLLALPVPEEAGGFGGSAIDTMVVMRELGGGLVVEPYLENVLAIELLKRSTSHMHLVDDIAQGSTRCALALHERNARYDTSWVETTAIELAGGGYSLSGTKTVVSHGASADTLIVSARITRAAGDRAGVMLFVVDAGAKGVSRTSYRTIDDRRAADIVFDQVVVPAEALIKTAMDASALLDLVTDIGTVALCGEALGVMDELQRATVEYLRTRKQFGVVLGQFQSLQHRAVDMYIELEQAVALTTLAAMRVDGTADDARRHAVSAAKLQVNSALKFVGQQAVHLHGGIGVTEELPVSHYFKRATIMQTQFGDASHHMARYTGSQAFRTIH